MRIAAVVGVLALSALIVGCAAKQPAGQDLVASVTEASAGITSLKAVVVVNMTIDATGTETPTSVKMDAVGESEIDVAGKKAHSTVGIDLEAPGEGTQSLPVEIYSTDEWQYVNVHVDGSPFWGKSRQTATWMKTANLAGQQLELLSAAKDLKVLPDERVDDDICNVVEFTPDVPRLVGIMLRQSRTQDSMGLKESDFAGFDFTRVVKSVAMRIWIDRKTHLIRRAEAKIAMELTPADFGVAPGEFDVMTLQIGMDVRLSDYNKALKIEIPADVLAAPETPNMK